MRASFRCLAGVMLAPAPPNLLLLRNLTSTNTISLPSRMIRSISPKRLR